VFIVHGHQVWSGAVAAGVIALKQSMPEAWLPTSHALQETFGHIGREADSLTAAALNISRADMHGVMSRAADKRIHEADNAGKFFARRSSVKVPESVAGHIRKILGTPDARHHLSASGAGRSGTRSRRAPSS
jgi:hypothetical protein